MNEWLPKFKGENLLAEIEKSTAGLTYISETDSPVEPYSGGKVDAVKVEHITSATRHEEMSPSDFFARLTADRDWYGPEQKETAERFTALEKLLEANLRDLIVFKIGRVRIDIYVVGIDADNNLIGIKTKAVET